MPVAGGVGPALQRREVLWSGVLPSLRRAAIVAAALGCQFDATGLSGGPVSGTSITSATATATATSTATSTSGAASTMIPSTGDASSGVVETTGGPQAKPRWELVLPADGIVALDLALTAEGHPLVAGALGTGAASDAWLVCLDRELGGTRWKLVWDLAGDGDQGNAIAVAGAEVVMLGDSETASRGRDAWLLRVGAANGAIADVIQELGDGGWHPSQTADEWGMALARDPAGAWWIGGTRCARPCAGSEAWLDRRNGDDGKPSAGWDAPLALAGGMVRGVGSTGGQAIAAGTTGYNGAPVAWTAALLRVSTQRTISGQSIDAAGSGDVELLAVAEGVDGSLWAAERAREVNAIGGALRRYDGADLTLAATLPQGGEAVDVAFAGGRLFAVGSSGTGADGVVWVRAFNGEGEPIWSYEQGASGGAAGLALAIDEARGEVVALAAVDDGGRSLWLGRFGWDGDL